MRILTRGICLVVFCLPLYLVKFEVFGIPTTVLELLIYALFISWLIKSFKFSKFKKPFTVHYSLFIAIVLILIGVSLATIFSSDLRTSAGIWKAWFIDPLLFFVVVVSTIKNFKQIKGVLYSLLLSGIVVSIISLVYLIQGKLDPVGRLQAFYNSPNYLAMFLAPGLIIGIWFLINSRKIKNILLFTVYCSLFVVILYSTHSYGAWMGIIAAICFGLVLYFYKLGRKKFALTILYLALMIILFSGYLALIQREASFDARLIIWQKAWQIFKANPVLGIGPGTFGNYFLPYPEWGVPQPHNIFLAFLLQTGLIGFIGFIWLLIWFYRPKAGQPRTDKKRTSIVLMSIMTYILVHGLVDTTYWKNDLAVIFWLIIALYYTKVHLSYSQRKDNLLKEREIDQ